MENENLTPETASEPDSFEREERCCKAIKNVGKAILMRLAVVVLILWAFTRAELSAPLIGLMIFVILMDLSALPPLVKEWKARQAERKAILESEE